MARVANQERQGRTHRRCRNQQRRAGDHETNGVEQGGLIAREAGDRPEQNTERRQEKDERHAEDRHRDLERRVALTPSGRGAVAPQMVPEPIPTMKLRALARRPPAVPTRAPPVNQRVSNVSASPDA